jgi:hypothetical protein
MKLDERPAPPASGPARDEGSVISGSADFAVAGRLKASDWWKARETLVVGQSPDQWSLVFERFFRKRLETRYLKPIEALRALRTDNGEGFSVVAIQCTLIEYLAATTKGENYRHLKKGEKLGEHEYSDSGGLFVGFLTGFDPFRTSFKDEASARAFYGSVRCGLLHEARTKDRWTISARPNRLAVDTVRGIVYRNVLQQAILAYVNAYGVALRDDKTLQEGFLRKFDVLAGGQKGE